MKKFMSKLVVLTLVVAVLTTCMVGLTGCFGKGNPSNKPAENPVKDASFVNVSINPNIDLVVDDDGTVLSVVANNEDAEKLLLKVDVDTNKTYAEGVKGKQVSVAVNTIVKASVDLEYINDTNKDVKILAIKANGSVDEAMLNKAKTAVHTAIETAKENGKLVADFAEEVVTEVTNSVNRRLENAKEQLKAVDKQAAEALTAGKLVLMETIEDLTNGAIALEDSIKMSVAELNRYIYDLSQEVKVVAQGAAEKIQEETLKIYNQAKLDLEAAYKNAEPKITATKFAAVKLAKNGFVALQENYVDFINDANVKSMAAYNAMKVAPNTTYGQSQLNDKVDEIANELFTDEAKKVAFKEAAKTTVKGETEARYTYRSVEAAVNNELDNLDTTGSTGDAAVAKGHYENISSELTSIETKYAEEITAVKSACKKAVKAAQTGMGKIVGAYVTAVAAFNKEIGAPAPAKAPEKFTTYAQLLSYVSDLLTTQNANIEKAFTEYAYGELTPEVQKEITDAQNAIANAKTTAKELYESYFNPQVG